MKNVVRKNKSNRIRLFRLLSKIGIVVDSIRNECYEFLQKLIIECYHLLLSLINFVTVDNWIKKRYFLDIVIVDKYKVVLNESFFETGKIIFFISDLKKKKNVFIKNTLIVNRVYYGDFPTVVKPQVHNWRIQIKSARKRRWYNIGRT